MKEEFVSLPLQLEVPQSDGEFKLGLMFRESLEQDRGMLFIFESNDYWTFHMKNTFIPLDIAFIKEDGTIDSIKELDPMNPIPVYPDSEVRYAVEVNRGWFAENGVEVGDIILEDIEEAEIDLTEVKDKKGKGSGTKDACYHKVKSRYSVWPSAYASGALVKCRKVGAANWGNKSESVEYEVNEEVDKDFLKKVKNYGRESEITSGMSDREYVKHLKSTGNYKKKKNKEGKYDYNFSHHKDDKYKDKIKAYDDASAKRVQDALDKKQAQKDKVEKEYKQREIERRGGVEYKLEKPKYTIEKPKLIRTTSKAVVKKEHYDWRDTLDEEMLDEGKAKLVKMGVKAVKNILPKKPPALPTKLPTQFTPTRKGIYGSITRSTGGSGGSGGGKNFVSGLGDKFKRNAGALTTGGIVGAEIQNAVNQGKIKELEAELDAQKQDTSYLQGVIDGKKSNKGSKEVKSMMKDVKPVKKEHYNWRDSFDENNELDEQLLGALRRAGSAVGGAVQKVGSALKSRPIQGRVSRSSQNMAGKPKPEATQATQATQASPAPQAKPVLSDKSPAAKAGIPLSMRQAAADRNAKFQAAKKSGNLAQYRQDNPKLSGREKAQAMAKARIASKNVQSNSPTAQKPTVDKVPPAAQAKPAGGTEPVNVPKPGVPTRKVTSSTTQSGNTTTTQTNVKSGVTGGTTKDLTSSAGSLQKNQQKAKQLANTANKNAAMSGSGATTSVGKINFGGF